MASNSTNPCPKHEVINSEWNDSENWCYNSLGLTGFYDLIADKGDDTTCYTNCSQICTDPKFLLSDYGTIGGCLNWDTFSRNNLIVASSHEEVNRAHLIAIDLLNSCMQAYCDTEDDNLGGFPYKNISLPDNQSQSTMWPFETSSGACDVIRTVNSDLGGPGVLVSYYLEINLAWLIAISFFLIRWSNSYKSWLRKLSIEDNTSSRSIELEHNLPLNPASLEYRELPNRPSQDHPSSERKGLPEETNTRSAIMKDVLAEFQESQCYFILATHTAAFVAIARGNLFGATSFRQASANCYFILVMAEVSTIVVRTAIWNVEKYEANYYREARFR
ncbi:hypothetical protein GJ744_005051 [Endocarpon pusillum]|uniref:Uncharacterized protein n=1 Tax=Endocarpon pusillum TaxID=364733 RepID=A0A8H7A8W4_9EURO|nr:hypothetical protein GJ744_005051 [Endocarpon pusillum]